MKRCIGCLVLTWSLATGTSWARFMTPDLEKIPVERLAQNLEASAKKDPGNTEVLFNLARLHAMAYALKTDTVKVWKGHPKEGAWLGHTPGAVPFTATNTDDEEKQAAAKKQLDKAIALYREVLKKNDRHIEARVGLGWCLEQAKKRDEAIEEYRAAIEEAWKSEGALESGNLGGYLTVEAAGYLIPLLDADRDKREIETLHERTAKLEQLPRPMTPIAVPLHDALSLDRIEDKSARVPFDADGTGRRLDWSWITPDAGWLVHDPKRTGKIDSALQMFGGVTFWLFWKNGYHALSALDDSGDGRLTGKELDALAIWQDKNGNGICEEGEVKPLADWGIVAVSCRYRRHGEHPDHIMFSANGVTFRNGATRPTYDLLLHPR